MADYPVDYFDGKTILEVAQKPTIDYMCEHGELGMCKKKVATTFKEPLRLLNEDVELEVKFNCAKCECELFLISSRRACGRNCMR